MKASKALVVLTVVMAGATVALGAGITSIGVLNPGEGGTVASAVNAISGDGQYAVGYSNGTVQYTDMTGNPAQFSGQIAVVWKAGTLTALPLTADNFGFERPTNTIATGVVIRPIAGTIGIGGGFLQTVSPNKMQMVYYEAPLSNLGGGVWKDNTLTNTLAGITGPYNTARLRNNGTEQWFVGGDRSGSERDFVMGVAGAPGIDHRNTGDCISYSVNGAGNTAGSDAGNPSGARRALYMNANNGTVQTVIPGGNGILSEAIGISAYSSNVILSGYDTDAGGNTQAFVWKPGDAAMTLLNRLAGDTQASAITVNKIGGNFIAGGYSSNGQLEQAVLWDTTGIWDSTGEAKLVSTLLSNAGFDVSQWTTLTRVTTMSDDGMTVAGYGVWAEDGTTRGFIATIPEPTSLLLLSLGGLALLRRNRR